VENSQYEPFGALDAKVRKKLRQGARATQDRTGLTTVFVTHDQEEAMELAELVVVMSMGRIEQVGNPSSFDSICGTDQPLAGFECRAKLEDGVLRNQRVPKSEPSSRSST
jgi:ABC-type sulfate/molybdate transport systems ATPase subunit